MRTCKNCEFPLESEQDDGDRHFDVDGCFRRLLDQINRYKRALEVFAKCEVPSPRDFGICSGMAPEDKLEEAVYEYAQHILDGGDPDVQDFYKVKQQSRSEPSKG